jgi:hypothetical protein
MNRCCVCVACRNGSTSTYRLGWILNQYVIVSRGMLQRTSGTLGTLGCRARALPG